MGHHTTLQALAALRGGFIALGMLAFAHCAAASENSPRMPPEQQPAAWQQAGLEAALADPDFGVQYHALDYCLRKKWVAQLHFSTEQWLKWLGHENSEVKALAAEAAGQLGAQMPAEVQRTLARLRKSKDADTQVRHAAARALLPLGAGMIPEVQLELRKCQACFLPKDQPMQFHEVIPKLRSTAECTERLKTGV
jgi:HEAT repeat protein